MGAEDDLSKLLFRMEKATKVRECGHMLTEEGAVRRGGRRGAVGGGCGTRKGMGWS